MPGDSVTDGSNCVADPGCFGIYGNAVAGGDRLIEDV